MYAVAVEGDSLAWQMRPSLERRLAIESYEAAYGMPTQIGVERLLARHVGGKIVLVSLGTNDAMLTDRPLSSRRIARQARRLVRVARCVVWSRVRITRAGFAHRQRIVNAGLERVRLLHLVRPPPPDYGDGVHFSARGARTLAGRFARAAIRECGATPRAR